MHRTLLAIALAGAFVAPMWTAQAAAQEVEGTILAPTVEVPGNPVTGPASVLSRHARCAYLAAGADSNGLVGWTVALDGSGSSFSLTSSTAGANPDVVFYADLGTCTNMPGATVTGTFAGPGAESGSIPAGSSFAIIVVRDAANASFKFVTA